MTDLAHSRRGVDIPLNARQDGAVVDQENAVLLPTAALQVPVFICMDRDGPHCVWQRAIIGNLSVFHSYCSKRRISSWNADGGYGGRRIVAAPIDN